jgi:ABC-2 type transport system ATP-binding protein
MTGQAALEFHDLSKTYGDVVALDHFSATVTAGRITAFLGANGSGKTTSMRVLLGLTEASAGSATIGGRRYADLRHPTRTVGAVLDQGLHPNRTARNTLRLAAAYADVPLSRVDDVLDIVGLTDVAGRRVGGFSLGMRQRLGLATALVGNPEVLVLDEPFNGLDPQGIADMRTFLRSFADAGGTVFLSSHLLAEVAHSADDAVIIHAGALVSAGSVAGLMPDGPAVVLTSPDAGLLGLALERRGATVRRTSPDSVVVRGLPREDVGRAALDVGAVIVDMRAEGDDLEAVFSSLISTARVAATGRLTSTTRPTTTAGSAS